MSKKIKITVYLPTHLHDDLIDEAALEHRSVTAQVEHLLDRHYRYWQSPYFWDGGLPRPSVAKYQARSDKTDFFTPRRGDE